MDTPTTTATTLDTAHDIDDVTQLVRHWLAGSREFPVKGSAKLLAGLLAEEGGLAFLTEFVDGVIRPEDTAVAARAFRDMAARDVPFLPVYQRVALRVGSLASHVLPTLVVVVARRAVRLMVSHLIVDATPRRLTPQLARLRARGHRLNVNLLGEAVLGEKEAARRLRRITTLLSREDVDYVSLKVSSAIAPHNPWAFDSNVKHIVDSLRPLFAVAMERRGAFINLDMEEYKDLDLTIEVFTTLLDEDEFNSLTAGIVLQAYLPDSMEAMQRLQTWAAKRVARGGAPIKVRLVKGANLSMERVDAELHGWPLATWGSKAESDAHYKRLLGYALTPQRILNVRIGVAGHNLFDIAHAHLTSLERGVSDAIDFEMLLGMGEHVAAAVSRDVGALRLYTPVVHPREFDVALAYLVRRLEEVASKENFMSSLYELDANPVLFARERQRFADSWALVPEVAAATHRAAGKAAVAGQSAFANAHDTDPSLPASRRWGKSVLATATSSVLGVTTLVAARVEDSDRLRAEVALAHAAARDWQRRSPEQRARVLRDAGAAIEAHRGELIDVMASEAGKTIDQADPEVSEAVDFAHYYAERSLELWNMPGASPAPRGVTLVTPPWNFPVAIPAGSTLAALGAGSAVILKPAPQAARCGAVLAEVLWSAGVPRDVLRLIDIDTDVLGDELIRNEHIDQVILTGAFDTAQRMLSVRPGLRLLAETSGKNSIIVTPAADVDLAVKDIVASAFGHAGQKCSAASLVIVVGSVALSKRFLTQLEDAVRSLEVGPATSSTTQMGPVIGPVHGKLRRALTALEPGEEWIVEPRNVDGGGRLWSPGLKSGVVEGSFFHQTECFGPVLGVMAARSLDEAIRLQNGVDYGLTAGLHSLDETEIRTWLGAVQAGNVYVNRSTTGAIVRRQPFGGWKRSAVGPTVKAGGPHYLTALTGWTRGAAPTGDAAEGVVGAFLVHTDAAAWVRDAAAADARAWVDRFGVATDESGLECEVNLMRYVPAHADIRWDGQGDEEALARVCAARIAAGGEGAVSSPAPLPARLVTALGAQGVPVRVETWDECVARASERLGGRIRWVGEPSAFVTAGTASVAVFADEVTAHPAVELLPFLKEQAVSMTAHRFGTPSSSMRAVVSPA